MILNFWSREKGALVLLSGGQDSATCLALTKESGIENLHAIAFSYGQRHEVEIVYSAKLAKIAGAEFHLVPINSFQAVSQSNLIGSKKTDIAAPHPLNKNLPSSFVPGRNLIFLTLAAALAYRLGIHDLVTGVCQTDYSGYPDCRRDTIDAMETALGCGLDYLIKVHTPLMYKTKADTIKVMENLDHLDWYAETQTCYEGMRPPCGKCPACLLRAKGFAEIGIPDPLLSVASAVA